MWSCLNQTWMLSFIIMLRWPLCRCNHLDYLNVSSNYNAIKVLQPIKISMHSAIMISSHCFYATIHHKIEFQIQFQQSKNNTSNWIPKWWQKTKCKKKHNNNENHTHLSIQYNCSIWPSLDITSGGIKIHWKIK